jgi:hypothetical protein
MTLDRQVLLIAFSEARRASASAIHLARTLGVGRPLQLLGVH